jgi:peroxiredoxin
MMRRQHPKVEVNAVAPDFTLRDFRDREVSLSAFRGVRHVLLVFSRGFT